METSWWYKVASFLRPHLRTLSGRQQMGTLVNFYVNFYTLPLIPVGLIWLWFKSDLSLLRGNLPFLLVFFVAFILVRHFAFRFQLELGLRGMFATREGSFESLVLWSGVFLVGPTILWTSVLVTVAEEMMHHVSHRFRPTRQESRFIGLGLLIFLPSITVYEQLGGTYPLTSLGLTQIAPAFAAIILSFLVELAILLPFYFILYRLPSIANQDGQISQRSLLRFHLLATLLDNIDQPFAILAAGLFALNGLGIYTFFMLGALGASWMAQAMSQSLLDQTQRTRELAGLEAFDRALLDLPPDMTALAPLLDIHIPRILPYNSVHIWFHNSMTLFATKADEPLFEYVVRDMDRSQAAYFYYADTAFDFAATPYRREGLAVPIVTTEGERLGGVFVAVVADLHSVMESLTTLQAIAADIAAIHQRTVTYRQTLANERLTSELALAGRIQTTFLPHQIPQVEGWDIAATLIPARHTSGDFYDFFQLDDHHLGVLVADVADKGTAAALYMALSRTLIRTFAFAHPDDPALVLSKANRRILADTTSDQFVTVFYGVLDLRDGTLIYSNAGHNPAYVLRAREHVALTKCGAPLGIMPTLTWRNREETLDLGDRLIIYSDGVTEAQNEAQELWGEERLLVVGHAGFGRNAHQTQQSIIDAVQEFAGDAPQHDDITLLVVARGVPH